MLQFSHDSDMDIDALYAEVRRVYPGASLCYGIEEAVLYVENVPEADEAAVQAIIDAHNPSVTRSRERLLSGDVAPRTSPLFRSVSKLQEREVKRQWQRAIRPNSPQT